MPGTASISGVVSGLKTDEIIAKLLELEGASVRRLEAKKAALQTKLTAWQDLNTRVLALQTKANALSTKSAFQVKSFTSSDEDIATGSASPTADVGTYFLKVTQLAKTHQIKTQGYADINTTKVGTGTVTIQVGTGDEVEITIDDTNNTLAGLRDAINKSDAEVTASIINDGTGTPYRLVITSDTMGTDGEVTLESTLSGGTTPTFSDLQAAQDASITFGEGAGAITVTKSTNTVTDLIPGVTLNLVDADASKTITVNIRHNTASIKQNIKDFVEQFNNLMTFIEEQSDYDPETSTAASLFGDSNLRFIQSDLRSRISNPITGLSQSIKVLSQIGITTSGDRLIIDETDLDKALADDVNTVMRLFAKIGEASNPNIQYVYSTAATKPSSVGGYAVSITTAATQARVTAGVAQTTALLADETLVINEVEIELTAGMTQSQVVSEINEHSNQTGILASATDADGSGTGNYLTLRRIGYGSALTISGVSDVSNGGGSPKDNTTGIGITLVTETDPDGESGTGTGAAGVNVAGTINGEDATGSGQLLTGNEGNENTDGLKIRVTGTTTGSYGTIVFTKGIAGLISEYVSLATEAITGTISNSRSSLESAIDNIDDDLAELNEHLTDREEYLVAQFTAMESALNRLQTQGQFLTQQITAAQSGWG